MTTVLETKQSIRPSIASNSLAVKAAQEEIQVGNSPSLRSTYENLMNQLEMDGISKEQVSTVGQKIIIEQKKLILQKVGYSEEGLKNITVNSWWFEVARENNYINPHFSHSVATEQERQNSSINTKNKRMIMLLMETMEITREAITKFKEIDELETIFGEKETKEFYLQMEGFLTNTKYAFDEKTKVPQNTEHMLLEFLATTTSLSYSGQLFLKAKVIHLGNQIKYLTSKQATKFQRGDKQSKLPLYKPSTRDIAIYANYYGVQCPECDSWRVREKSDSSRLECFDCDHNFFAKTVSKCSYCQIPLYKERLEYIVEHGVCEHCNSKVDLPKDLIMTVKSL